MDKYESTVSVLEVVDRGPLIFGRLHCPEMSVLTETFHKFKCKLFFRRLLDNRGNNRAFHIEQTMDGCSNPDY